MTIDHDLTLKCHAYLKVGESISPDELAALFKIFFSEVGFVVSRDALDSLPKELREKLQINTEFMDRARNSSQQQNEDA